MSFPDDPSFDPFERLGNPKEITLKDKLASRPLNESQLYNLPSEVKRHLRDGRWCLLKPEHYDLYRHDETAVFLQQNGKAYEKLGTSRRSKSATAIAFIRYRPLKEIEDNDIGGSGGFISAAAIANYTSRQKDGGYISNVGVTAPPATYNRDPWLSMSRPAKGERIHISAALNTRSRLLSRTFKTVVMKQGETAATLAKQYYGRADARLIYQFNPQFSQQVPPTAGVKLRIQDGWALGVEVSTRYLSSVDVRWVGTTQGQAQTSIAMDSSPDSDPSLTEIQFPVRAGEYTVTISGGELSETRKINITEDPVPTDWLKIQALHNDPWQTPLPLEHLNVSVNGVLAREQAKLNKGMGTNTSASSQDQAEQTAQEPGVLILKDISPGDVVIKAKPGDGLLDEIKQQKEILTLTLDGAYRNVVEQMNEFQQQWDKYGYASIAINGADGLYQGSASWVKDQASLFEAETWSNLGGQIKGLAGDIYDYTATHAVEAYNKAKATADSFADLVEDEHIFSNWAWWQQQAGEAFESAKETINESIDDLKEAYSNAIDAIGTTKERIEKMIQHQDAILNLPNLIASGDVAAIEHFIDNELMDIDAETAQSIKENPDFYLVLALIEDHDTSLTYLAYTSLFLEAVPPNFYAFIAGKGSGYVVLEIILMIVLSFLTLGAGAVARLTTIAARLAKKSASVANSVRKLKKAQQAIQAFTDALINIADAATQLKGIGKNLSKAKTKGLLIKGKTGQTLTAKKESTKRDKKCRCCGSDKHTTPRKGLGIVEYE